MDIAARFETLIDLIESAGVEIRREPLGGDGGGLCRMKGRQILFIDQMADVEIRYDRTLTAAAQLSDWNDQFLVPELREDIERVRRELNSA